MHDIFEKEKSLSILRYSYFFVWVQNKFEWKVEKKTFKNRDFIFLFSVCLFKWLWKKDTKALKLLEIYYRESNGII